MCFRNYGLPYGLYGALIKLLSDSHKNQNAVFGSLLICTLHLAVTSFGATLDMDVWLGLTQQGLSPCKKYQALLGVLTNTYFRACWLAQLLPKP